MKRTLAVALTVFLVSLPASAHEEILDKKISLNLKDAKADELFPLFAVLIDTDLELDYDTDQAVNLVFDGISARTGLNAFCESIGCGWRLIDGEPPVLRFYSLEKMLEDKRALAYDRQISLDLQSADAAQVLRLAGHVLDVEVDADESIAERPVTMVRKQTTISEFLDEVCLQIDCEWRLAGGAPTRLKVTAGNASDERPRD